MYYVMYPEYIAGRLQGWFVIQSKGITKEFAEFAEAKRIALKRDGRVHSRADGNRVVYQHQPADLVPKEDRAVKSQAERRASWARFVESQLFVNA